MELYPGYLEDHFNIHKLSISSASPPEYMTSASTQFAAPVRMGAYDRPPPVGMWSHEQFKVDNGQATSASTIMEAEMKFENRLEEIPQVVLEEGRNVDQEASKPPDKVLRRLAQNREAARKSRLRKKAYIQQLETSRLKLAQLEQELQRARQQAVYANGSLREPNLGFTGPIDPGALGFEIKYSHWVDEQNRNTGELRNALLQGQTTDQDLELKLLVEAGLDNYNRLFEMKEEAANSDVFYIMSGMWKTPTERFFLWIGGFRPSEVLKNLRPQLEPLTDKQVVEVGGLQQTSMQVEDALSQGMDKLKQTIADSLTAADPFDSPEAYMVHMANAVEQLRSLVQFVTQADHLRQQTLQEMHRILTTRQAARGLLALGDYFQRFRALSSLWAARPRDSGIS
ncbi:transcription factor TGAL6 [Oryza sativa Japonica Group]|uniref:Transcription factor TGAL6 n=12 Tax=Oryza TaxID=4527 RepID=TGAL6_ORYSJ|nr:transcription factor TGAL6 [Oryza sativa Japonica Group]XP_015636713.1 transcription factor TGAL6 isoform X2 [Oryza sativa Japonica Group]XP_015636714.1 transcription factor TGAL6 isoform X2 [Oryza sativa Japonica Group]XP_052152901.1 transcription factor TGAL6 isoform X2 [Oryza glaberrima]XP_052152902.1 transcription factor TGAL6 isoform X2 [Oryza glaberrima]XP_052152903.1 transcription factor TGAL6 isoform X2 [Oryza glaberrima]XP_052152904.1 transcription factor TGAL6 isoform X2 [Oryza g